MKKGQNKTESKLEDDLRPEYDIDYSKTWPNPYAGRVKPRQGPARSAGFSHGGPRPGAGRRPRFGRPMIRKTIRLTEKEIAHLERLGAGNLSEGIRTALRQAAPRR